MLTGRSPRFLGVQPLSILSSRGIAKPIKSFSVHAPTNEITPFPPITYLYPSLDTPNSHAICELERTIFVPISEKQHAANRANAGKSTGPRTPEGKARSCQNARTHRFTASTFAVVRLEEFDEIARLKHDLLAVYQPVNSQELFALEQMALAQQTMFRAARLESGIFTTCLDMALNHDGTPFIPMSPDLVGGGDIEITHAQNCNYALADGFHRLARKDNTFPLFLRYKIQTERLYRRAVEEFDRLKALRPELPNEAILEAQPEEKEPTYAPPDEPISTPQPEAPKATALCSSSSEDSAKIVGQVPDLPDPISSGPAGPKAGPASRELQISYSGGLARPKFM
jgi:hypothetical protein